MGVTALDRPARPFAHGKHHVANGGVTTRRLPPAEQTRLPESRRQVKPHDARRSPKHLRKWIYQRLGAPVGFGLAFAAVAVGWIGRDVRGIDPEEGLGYLLGIVAVGCMLILLVYPLRKRWKMLSFLGTVKNWFRTHMLLGVLGPLTALYHCNFQLGSLNSQVALFSALLVAGSGLIGRFLYAKIHQGLYGRKTDLKKLRVKVNVTSHESGSVMKFMPQLMQRINVFDQEVLQQQTGVVASLVLLSRLTFRTRSEYGALIRFTKKRLALEARLSPIVAKHERRLLRTTRRFVAAHMLQIRRIAKLQAYDRLFSLWHVAHLPFFFLLVITTVIHVFAVHLY